MYICLHVKCPLFLSDFNEISTLSTYFRKILKYKISWKSVLWELICSMTDGRKDMTQLIEFAILRTFLKISCVKYEYETTLEQLLPLPGNEPRMSFPIVISIVNDVHSAAHKQSSTQNYVQDKIKILPKSSFSVFSALLSRHTQKNKFLLFGY
jgi:hypothetical protein